MVAPHQAMQPFQQPRGHPQFQPMQTMQNSPLFQQSQSQQPLHAQPPQQSQAQQLQHAQVSPQSQPLQHSQQPQSTQSSQQPQLYQQPQPAQQAQQHTPEQVHSQIQIPSSVDPGQSRPNNGYFLGEIDPLDYVQQSSSAAIILLENLGRVVEQQHQESSEESRILSGRIAEVDLKSAKNVATVLKAIHKFSMAPQPNPENSLGSADHSDSGVNDISVNVMPEYSPAAIPSDDTLPQTSSTTNEQRRSDRRRDGMAGKGAGRTQTDARKRKKQLQRLHLMVCLNQRRLPLMNSF
ncbi:uncharacterized protein B0I36DRAFT_79842 [Microdochium trichocladiopsis]|uniref:Uncharacterized protein n=1 Tax=Microdochium trichocladiopsis TaxID=1682393 RepID=A0A9P9BER9_9PEZI|nr:uncharacterized protein B0I36DRAFT_79842 [Microdochium trichocladiopsis]KAH7009093.1 hypothetical protein B0I36DRAFT_79842 [Microdochium trichocladiopsis]